MTKWIYRAVGTVGVAAGGILLMAGGAAQADGIDAPVNDLRGSLDGFLAPLGTASVPRELPATQQLGLLAALPLDPAAGVDAAALEASPAGGVSALQLGDRTIGTNTVGDLLSGAGTAAQGDQLLGGQVGAQTLTTPPMIGGDPLGLSSPDGGDFSIADLGADDLDRLGGSLLPALIGDALAAEMAEGNSSATLPLVGTLPLAGLTDDDASPLADLQVLNTLGSLGGDPAQKPASTRQPAVSPTADDGGNDQQRQFSRSASERPVAGEDADFR